MKRALSPKIMDWFIERLQCTNPTLDFRDFSEYPTDFKKLLDLKIIKYSQTVESLPCEWCEQEHLIAPFQNNKKEIILSCSGNRRTVSPDELKIWTINKETLIENVKSKNRIVDKALFEQTGFASQEKETRNPALYITKDTSGYYFDGNPVYIKSKNAQYTVIFDATYFLNPNGGIIKYTDIIKQCKQRGKKKVSPKSILRALTGKDANLFKYIPDIKQTPAHNVDLFVPLQNGKEIEFNNGKK